MTKGKYKSFARRLTDAMCAQGHVDSRSPSGICMDTLSEFADASVQICRRYIRGDALPNYERVIRIATHLNVSPSWLLFADAEQDLPKSTRIDTSLLRYIISRVYTLFHGTTNENDDFTNFVMKLVCDIQKINGDRETINKIVDLTFNSIASFKEIGHDTTVLNSQ